MMANASGRLRDGHDACVPKQDRPLRKLTALQAVSQLCPRLHSLNVSMCSGFSMHALIRVVRHLRDEGRLRKLHMDELQVRGLMWLSATLMSGSKRGTSIKGTSC